MKAKKNLFITAAILLSIISSCAVISFYPLYTDDVLKRDDRIIGKWFTIEDIAVHPNDVDTLIWEITFNDKKKLKKQKDATFGLSREIPNEYAYSLFSYYKSSPEDKVEFLLHLVELDGKTYVDFYPEECEIDNPILFIHLMGVHTFAKIDIDNEYVNIDWLNAEWFEEKLKGNKIRIKHEKNNNNILLTAQPKDLQKFIIKYSDNKNAFDEDSKSELRPIE